ncbi:NADPH-dependent 7-cyano-7-deazaguanine reductase QueF [Paraphotobacterium marinum]|uniref:NADPH-dependent 7-cyano-7-deazaguanine reductase n=1 Tax=Paraphotobacterium marinum TaxID=1755811 RepID=A0A220VFW1_9GAMM|nr:NADPH-dependent 7-cyano-7-deazaguanine reductase QueF [Paraphotobacterium marinum]ASK79308.1 NADPH-dependent 7-cyano-7-deazaguanine reductase QueF [Paraphotobacterium marinum]
MLLDNSELGKKSAYKDQYDPSLLFPIPRQTKRDEIHISKDYQFEGCDIWNAFEVSWLNSKGKPVVRIMQFRIDANSLNIIESKSFKLYLNSFNNTKFANEKEVLNTLQKDLELNVKGVVSVKSSHVDKFDDVHSIYQINDTCIDDLDIEIDDYEINPSKLKIDSNTITSETITSHLLKSNCLITNQPDWGSLIIKYEGPKINREGLLKYIISFRNHNEFHEQCVERIYMDIMKEIKPQKLLVYARYTRRGGLDINPLRANYKYDSNLEQMRLVRQ